MKLEPPSENPYSAPQVLETTEQPPRQRLTWRIVLQHGLNNAVWIVLALSIVLVPLSCIPEINSTPSSGQELIDFVVRGLGGLGWSAILGVAIGIPGTFLLAMLNDELKL